MIGSRLAVFVSVLLILRLDALVIDPRDLSDSIVSSSLNKRQADEEIETKPADELTADEARSDKPDYTYGPWEDHLAATEKLKEVFKLQTTTLSGYATNGTKLRGLLDKAKPADRTDPPFVKFTKSESDYILRSRPAGTDELLKGEKQEPIHENLANLYFYAKQEELDMAERSTWEVWNPGHHPNDPDKRWEAIFKALYFPGQRSFVIREASKTNDRNYMEKESLQNKSISGLIASALNKAASGGPGGLAGVDNIQLENVENRPTTAVLVAARKLWAGKLPEWGVFDLAKHEDTANHNEALMKTFSIKLERGAQDPDVFKWFNIMLNTPPIKTIARMLYDYQTAFGKRRIENINIFHKFEEGVENEEQSFITHMLLELGDSVAVKAKRDIVGLPENSDETKTIEGFLNLIFQFFKEIPKWVKGKPKVTPKPDPPKTAPPPPPPIKHDPPKKEPPKPVPVPPKPTQWPKVQPPPMKREISPEQVALKRPGAPKKNDPKSPPAKPTPPPKPNPVKSASKPVP